MNATALRKHYSEVRQRLNTPPAKKKEVEKPVVVEMVQQCKGTLIEEVDPVLKEIFRYKPKERVLEILKGTGFTLEDVRGTSRVRRLVQLRQHISWVLCTEFGWSKPKTGMFICKDHTTVLHGVNQWEKMLKQKEAKNDNARDD